ncbi:hypothetical protein NYQ43_09015 [Xanthomonas translucens pv. translucens]|uniref:hypothetical protein n=1 Tax=Xanthomonas campestris pv. translucens TaxID=343 RepID=UPI0021B77EB9|nr:hypothetical protein [Xanthomonas translucens]MCT8285834.1 hypothetical protein [Xanthomonas translucens pv. translucens]MCT8303492.1 hypothetical protein [Xanthomonas translucens pv. translucens]
MLKDKETTGAWIVHHGRKLVLDANGAAEFPAIDEAAKASTLLAKFSQADDAEIPMAEVKGIATASGLNPRHELAGLLDLLERKKLLQRTDNSVVVLGITTRAALGHAAEIYKEADPSAYEDAAITLAEMASESPVRRNEIEEKIGDIHRLSSVQISDFISRAMDIGFVDHEGDKNDSLLFNGNLFRRGSVEKASRVLGSLSQGEQRLLGEVQAKLQLVGCLGFKEVEQILGMPLFEKIIAAGLFDLNEVNNEDGSHIYVTSPSSFHKFVDPLIDDCFDMAKSLVAALVYGMTSRQAGQGRIQDLPALLRKLVAGFEVGPTTSIGEDYRVLEIARVVKTRQDLSRPGRFYLRLVKREVGELALQVLTQGNANEVAIAELASAPMSSYIGPEENRRSVRKRQNGMSRQKTRDVLEAVRGGRAIR